MHSNLLDYAGMETQLAEFDVCFFCLGVASTVMKEADYERVTYGFTMAAAEAVSRAHPGMTFIFVSGSGTDSTEMRRIMWARVKGRTENALPRLPLKAYMFRPGFIQPLDGIQSKTPLYRRFYRVLGPAMPLLRRLFPSQILSTRGLGLAIIVVARHGYSKHTLETRDLRTILRTHSSS